MLENSTLVINNDDDNDDNDDEVDNGDDDDAKIVPYHPTPLRQVWSVNASVEKSTRRFKELLIHWDDDDIISQLWDIWWAFVFV